MVGKRAIHRWSEGLSHLRRAAQWIGTPLGTAIAISVAVALVLVAMSYEKYADPTFWDDVRVEAHGMVLDLLVIGVFAFAIQQSRDRRATLRRFQEQIDDLRDWKSEESSIKIVANARRLIAEGVTNIDLRECYLKQRNLAGLHLAGSGFWGADLGYANLRGATLNKAKFFGAYLGDANLRGADCTGADFERARCQRASFRGTKLRGASLTQTKLWSANLNGADLRGADLSGAILKDATLRNARLGGARVTAEQLLTAADIHGAQVDPQLMEALIASRPDLACELKSSLGPQTNTNTRAS
jgi:uncharacterized protein YjbI with pentapeptide repeats